MRKKFIYIFFNFLKIFLIVSFIFVILFLLIQIIEDLPDFLLHRKSFVLRNYIYTSPLLFVQISPIITILSSMLVLSEMLKNNEIKVFFLSGNNPFKIFSIFLLCGLFSSIFAFTLKNFVSPPLIKKIKNTIKQEQIAFSSPKYFFYSDRLENKYFINVEFSEYFENGEFIIIKAKRAKNYESFYWIFESGTLWRFDSEKNLVEKEKFNTKNILIFLTYEILSISTIDIETFSYFQLSQILNKMKKLGIKPVSLITYTYEKIFYPLLNFFLIFIIFPFLKKSYKISNLYVFSFSFLFSFSCYFLYIFFFSLSKNGKIHPFFGNGGVIFVILIYIILQNIGLKKIKKSCNIFRRLKI
ncbi:MAG: LptF/LptG family permease [Candidatus Omnitrophica bacterium]|nr:LptF/LptG family permease [Candidatus Omnitrophota bacterium]MCM8809699.1 LptF/LptG family permease [Candidatus Omnitrophota bacterium]MCM8810631.1 LptF/LptG family permease [Candidatus Omnitrophota bacterium]